MYNMADSRRASPSTSLLVMFCAAVILLGLTAHFVADAACWSPEFANPSECGPGGGQNGAKAEQPTFFGLHFGVVLPTIILLGKLIILAFVLPISYAFELPRFFPPPVRPPIALDPIA